MKYLIAFLAMLIAGLASGQTFMSGPKVVVSERVDGNLYVSGGYVIVNAPVRGDLVATGGVVVVNDSVTRDLLVAGAKVYLNGVVSEDIRCAGGSLKIASNGAGDVIVTGGDVRLLSNGSANDFFVLGGNIVVDGTIRKTANVTCQNFQMNGQILGDAEVRGTNLIINGKIDGKIQLAATESIVIGNQASFSRVVRYWMPMSRPIKMPTYLHGHPVAFDPLLSITYSKWYFLGATNFLGLLWYLGMILVMIGIFEYLFSSAFSRSAALFHARPLRCGVLGAAFIAGVPIAAVLLIATIIAIPVGVLVGTSYVALLLLATTISALNLAHLVQKVGRESWPYRTTVSVALFVFMLLKIVYFTPFFGKLIWMCIVCLSFGSILLSIKWARKNQPPHASLKVKTAFLSTDAGAGVAADENHRSY